ncbi:MAG: hypothetical protein KF886_15310 [Candidatus Hydrogenedentes bacterium]|nr:hypothetical protein [Candidatus Hydrogenedentota bacterium]
MAPQQYEIAGAVEQVNVAKVVRETALSYAAMTIDVPRIALVPRGESAGRYVDFDLDLKTIRPQPVESDLISQGLHDAKRYSVSGGDGIVEEERLDDYLVRGLAAFGDVNYDVDAPLLYRLAGQMVAHLRSYLKDDDEVHNVLQYHQAPLVKLIHAQMQAHYEDMTAEYDVKVTREFTTIRALPIKAPDGEDVRDFRLPVEDKQRIRRMVFGGFRKCVYPMQRFDADSERRLAVVLENDDAVEKWVRLNKGDIHIQYDREGALYVPDFVVETGAAKYLCEPKADNEMGDETVLAKARAAAVWCMQATAHGQGNGGKPWHYLLIPDTAIQENKTLQGLSAAHRVVS